MKKFLILFFLIVPSVIHLFGQGETRVALVIGNANYEKDELKNPVNDALLMKHTLEELGFEVFYGENLKNKSEMLGLIREFGSARPHYDVAFVYYAGHGIQIGNENFLLPTHESYLSEFDVQDFGVSVQNIIRYLNSVTNKVNVFVLDACRNNPFENQWTHKRDLSQGSGLAKMAPPTGSLIAFSTEAGTTAADGEGENSVYCRSLSDNMKITGLSLDQLFRNVRAQVLIKTNEAQRPIEASQLTGQTFYLKPKTHERALVEIDSLLLSSDFDQADQVVDSYLRFDKNNASFLTKKGHILLLRLDESTDAHDDGSRALEGATRAAYDYYKQALEIDPDHEEAIMASLGLEQDSRDLGLLGCAGVIPESDFDRLENAYGNRFDFLLSRARNTMWRDWNKKLAGGVANIKNCRSAKKQLETLQKGLAEGKIDTSAVLLIGQKVDISLREVVLTNLSYACDCEGDYVSTLVYADQLSPSNPWKYSTLARAHWVGANQASDTTALCKHCQEVSSNGLKAVSGLMGNTRVAVAQYHEFAGNVGSIGVYTNCQLTVDDIDLWIALGLELLPHIESWGSDNKEAHVSLIRAQISQLEFMKGDYFAALRYSIQGQASLSSLAEYSLFDKLAAARNIELEVMSYYNLGANEASCAALERLRALNNEVQGVSLVYFNEGFDDALKWCSSLD